MKRMTLFIVLLLMIVTQICGCLDEIDSNEGFKYRKDYEIIVDIETIDFYCIFVPLPKDWDTIMDYLEIIDGNPSLNIIDTAYGSVLEINSTEDVRIRASFKSNSEPMNGYLISMYDSINGTAKFYCEKSPEEGVLEISFRTEYYNDDFNGGSGMGCSGNLENGWNEIKVDLTESD